MRFVLDTNAFVSAVFFSGVPGRILEAWRDGRLQLVLSAGILDEYQRVGQALSAQYAGVRASALERGRGRAAMVRLQARRPLLRS